MYDQFASDYDRFVNWKNRLAFEIPFIDNLLQGTKSLKGEPIRVLDAACGTGMHVLALAKAGYDVSGADISCEMVEKARENAATEKLNIRFENAGFGALAQNFGEKKFNAILCLGNSLPHLLSLTDLQEALNDFAACLRPNGLLLIQNRNFDAVVCTKDRWMEPQEHQEGDREWLFQRFYDFNPDGTIQFNIVKLTRTAQNPWEARVLSSVLRPLLQQELVGALTMAGFSTIRSYGSMGGEVYDTRASTNLVISAYKK